MYKLYWSPGSANMTPHALLEEIGAPFELIEVDLDAGKQHNPDYLKLNPHARVPTLIYGGGHAMYEAAAISLFLLERHPELGLAPLPGDPRRARFLQWMVYLTNTLQEALMHYWHADNFIPGVERQADLKQAAEQRVWRMFSFLDGELAARGPFLCGDRLTLCDYYLVMIARWTRLMAKPAHTLPHINKLVRAVMERPGYARMLKAEGIEQPA
ncbi:MAG TPA: glutathione S-transferase family protein [Dongiaceae bacterium]|nr:glutathione S-transferase family protein [Dongiaceae bacterium]